MKTFKHSFAATVLLVATLHPAWMQQAFASEPIHSTSVNSAEDSNGFAQIMADPFSSDLAGLPAPIKYGLLLIGLVLIEKLARRQPH